MYWTQSNMYDTVNYHWLTTMGEIKYENNKSQTQTIKNNLMVQHCSMSKVTHWNLAVVIFLTFTLVARETKWPTWSNSTRMCVFVDQDCYPANFACVVITPYKPHQLLAHLFIRVIVCFLSTVITGVIMLKPWVLPALRGAMLPAGHCLVLHW